MRRPAWIRCLGLTALSLLVPPAVATALPLELPTGTPPRLRALVRDRVDTPESAPTFFSRFALKTGSGFRVAVLGADRGVVVEVAREHGKALTAYIARGTVTRRRIQATFGDLGNISVRFQPSGRFTKSRARHHCRGADRYTRELGVYVGDIRFAGEDDYLALHAHRAKGQIRTPASLRCAPAPFQTRGTREGGSAGMGSAGSRSKLAFLSADWRHGVASSAFLAIGGGKRNLFLALTEQSEGSMAKLRIAFGTSGASAFAIDDALTHARVSPPAPFSGSGIYRAAPDGTKTWTGALAANFPGAPRLSLTGPEFETALGTGF